MEPRALLEHTAFLQALARSLLGNDALVDDVVQETWLAALRHPPRDPATARSWLGKVLVNFARRARRRKAAERLDDVTDPPGSPSELDMLARRNLARDVTDAVFDLPEPQRSCLVLRYYDGLPPREIGARLGVPVETVRTRIKRGLATLRQVLDRRYGDRTRWSHLLAPLTGASSLAPRLTRTATHAVGWMIMTKRLPVAPLLILLCLGLLHGFHVGHRGGASG